MSVSIRCTTMAQQAEFFSTSAEDSLGQASLDKHTTSTHIICCGLCSAFDCQSMINKTFPALGLYWEPRYKSPGQAICRQPVLHLYCAIHTDMCPWDKHRLLASAVGKCCPGHCYAARDSRSDPHTKVIGTDCWLRLQASVVLGIDMPPYISGQCYRRTL